MIEDIKRAIKDLNYALTNTPYFQIVWYREYIELALVALQEKLERLENKPLTFEQLKEMVGESVWLDCSDTWEVIASVHSYCGEDIDDEGYIKFMNGGNVDYKDSYFYKYKPCEEEN